MKTQLFIIALTFPFLFLAQSNELKLISISGQYNGNLWLPIDNASKTDKENGGKINVLTCKASLGGNMYSNWDQFKCYIWAGVGVELSFGGSKKVVE